MESIELMRRMRMDAGNDEVNGLKRGPTQSLNGHLVRCERRYQKAWGWGSGLLKRRSQKAMREIAETENGDPSPSSNKLGQSTDSDVRCDGLTFVMRPDEKE